MLLTPREFRIAVFNAVYMTVFTIIALRGANYEFLLYALVVILVAAWILFKQRTAKLSTELLWALSIWGLLHMAGGNIKIDDAGRVLYEAGLAVGVADDVADLRGGGVAAARHVGCAQPQQGNVCQQPLLAAVGDQPDVLAFLQRQRHILEHRLPGVALADPMYRDRGHALM